MVPADDARRRHLVFATRNRGKVAELVDLLRPTPWTVETMPSEVEEYPETGDTFAANARGKALHAAAVLDVPVLADDSGLQIDALDGAPGVRSARYIDPHFTPEERNGAVLNELVAVPEDERGARFVCHLVLAYRGALVHETVGTCEGRIGHEPRGEGGFGYDPIFVVPELDATFAEISRADKSARSHRGRAVRQMVDFLRSWEPA